MKIAVYDERGIFKTRSIENSSIRTFESYKVTTPNFIGCAISKAPLTLKGIDLEGQLPSRDGYVDFPRICQTTGDHFIRNIVEVAEYIHHAHLESAGRHVDFVPWLQESISAYFDYFGSLWRNLGE